MAQPWQGANGRQSSLPGLHKGVAAATPEVTTSGAKHALTRAVAMK